MVNQRETKYRRGLLSIDKTTLAVASAPLQLDGVIYLDPNERRLLKEHYFESACSVQLMLDFLSHKRMSQKPYS
jgi:hypothetical protein